MEFVVLLFLVAAVWLCPQQCLLPGFGLWPTVWVEHRLVFYGLVALLFGWATLRTVFRGPAPWKRCPLALCLVGLFFLGVLQLVPLSQGTLGALSPATAALYQEFLPQEHEIVAPDDPPPTTAGRTLSLDAPATRLVLVDLLAVLAFWVVVRHYASGLAGLHRLSIVAVANGAALAGYAIYHRYADHRSVYLGLTTRNNAFGPFLYRNLFALYINVCFGLGVGLLWAVVRKIELSGRFNLEDEEDEPPRLTWSHLLSVPEFLWVLLALALMAAAVIVCQSRGGLIVLLATSVLFWTFQTLRSRRLAGTQTLVWVALLGLGLASWLGFDWAASRYLRHIPAEDVERETRWANWTHHLPMLKSFPLWGIGYGTYPTADPLYHRDRRDLFDNHACNEYLEALVEGGLPRLALLLAAIFFVYRWGLRAYGRLEKLPEGAWVLGALFAFTTVVLHSFGEFGIHLPSIALLVILVCANLAGAHDATLGKAAPPPALRFAPGGKWLAAGVMLALGLFLLASGYQDERYRKLWHKGRESLVGTTTRSEDGLRYLQAAHRIAPEQAPVLADLGLLHYELYEAVQYEQQESIDLRTGVRLVAGAAMSRLGAVLSSAAAAQAETDAQQGARERNAQEHLLPALRNYIAARDLSPLLAKAHLGIALGQPRLARGEDFNVYLGRAKRLRPIDAETWFQCGRLELARGEPATAWQSLRRTLELAPHYLEPVLALCQGRLGPRELADQVLPDDPALLLGAAGRLYPRPGDAEKARPILERALTLLGEQPQTPAEWRLRAVLTAALGQDAAADQAFQTALARDPLQFDWHLEYAVHLHGRGRLAAAREELVRLLRLRPDHPQAKNLSERITRELTTQATTRELFDEPAHDFGSVAHGTKLTHRFRLRNSLKTRLVLGTIRTSCGCTTATAGALELAPGEETEVVVVVDTAQFTGPGDFLVRVPFVKPFDQRAELNVKAQSRSDVSLRQGPP